MTVLPDIWYCWWYGLEGSIQRACVRSGIPSDCWNAASPLGNSAGRPGDPDSQQLTLELALHLLETAEEPQTTLQSPLRWSSTDEWKVDYFTSRLTL